MIPRKNLMSIRDMALLCIIPTVALWYCPAQLHCRQIPKSQQASLGRQWPVLMGYFQSTMGLFWAIVADSFRLLGFLGIEIPQAGS